MIFFICLTFLLFSQITGQPSVLYFAQKLFQDAGFSLKDAGGARGKRLLVPNTLVVQVPNTLVK